MNFIIVLKVAKAANCGPYLGKQKQSWVKIISTIKPCNFLATVKINFYPILLKIWKQIRTNPRSFVPVKTNAAKLI